MAETTICEGITLVTLQSCPADAGFIAGIFERIAAIGVNLDMISLSPPQGSLSGVSFTIRDEDLGGILELLPGLREQVPSISATVSSGNRKIAVYDETMKYTPGAASAILKSAADAGADIRIITTSETEVSLLVTAATADAVTEKLTH